MEIFKEILNKKPDYKFVLPRPPSVNACYAQAGKRRIKSKAYNKWIDDANYSLLTGGRKIMSDKFIDPPYAIIYSFDVPDKRIRDCANFEKPLSDFLVKLGCIKDDSLIKHNHQYWNDKPGNSVTISIYSLSFSI